MASESDTLVSAQESPIQQDDDDKYGASSLLQLERVFGQPLLHLQNEGREVVNKLSLKNNKKRLRLDTTNATTTSSEWEQEFPCLKRKRPPLSSKLSRRRQPAFVGDSDKENMAYHHPHLNHPTAGGFHSGSHHASSYASSSSKALHSHHHHHHHHSGSGGGDNGVSLSLSSNHSHPSHSSSSKYSNTSNASSSAAPSSKAPAIGALCNLGNTCFLNSVLYTLRFTPGFIHNLHHMVHDLSQSQQTAGGSYNGAGSAGASHSSSGGGSSFMSSKSSKQRNALTNGINGHSTSNASSIHEVNGSGGAESDECMAQQDVIEQLHDLFKSLSMADESSDSSRDPIQPSSFLESVSRLNPVFEGNQQQDAHELLVMILNILEDTKIPSPPVSVVSQGDFKSEGNLLGYADNGPAGRPPFLPQPIADKKRLKKSKARPGNNPSSSGGGSQPHLANGMYQNGHIHASSSTSSLHNGGSSSSSSGTPPGPVPNFVKENFEGKSVMTTRCLECEMSTFRSEKFTNIDVPIHLDEDDDELSGEQLFLKQIMMSETLRENNKYWCEECSRLNEARRSVQFELLPKVMVLQLKRFTAATSSKCYVSKINDYIPTPFFMECFCKECLPTNLSAPGYHHHQHQQQQRADTPVKKKHRYRLYAVIMHLGATLASGHYIAYVRAADPSIWSDHQMCQRGTATIERNKSKKGFMKYLRRNTEPKHSTLSSSKGDNGQVGTENGTNSGSLPPCKSVYCCGIRGGLMASMPSYNSVSLPPLSGEYSQQQQHRGSLDSTDSGGESTLTTAQLDKACQNERWLECDDETITMLTKKEFDDILKNKKSASTTPYLLFYQRI